MHDLGIGKLITGDAQRDAIHVAVAPVVASELLKPRDPIGFIGTDGETVGKTLKFIGIVDPFLVGNIHPGEKFWMFMLPNTITSLRHDWTHPAFGPKPEPEVSDSEKWLRKFGDENGLSYQRVLDAAESFAKYGEYVNLGEYGEGVWANDEFWDHYERVTETKVPEAKRGGVFTCSC
jgi:hypothetical protein